MASGSGNVSNVLQWGGTDTTSNLIIPEANTQTYFALFSGSNGSGGNYMPLCKNGVAYQVPAGKTFKVVSVTVMGGASNATMQLVTATSAIAQNASTLTGGVFQTGAATSYAYAVASGFTPVHFAYPYDFAASTFAGVQSSSFSGCMVVGKEV